MLQQIKLFDYERFFEEQQIKKFWENVQKRQLEDIKEMKEYFDYSVNEGLNNSVVRVFQSGIGEIA